MEVRLQTEKHFSHINRAQVPFQKTLDIFDFEVPAIDPKIIRETRHRSRCVSSGENVLVLGPPGVGKIHQAVALGRNVASTEFETLFLTAMGLMTTVGRAYTINRFEEN